MTYPRFDFFVGCPPTLITALSEQWSVHLPTGRSMHSCDSTIPPETAIRYGDYFTAAANFLAADQMEILLEASRHALGHPVSAQAIDQVRVHLIKHGAFYHPAQVTWTIEHQQVRMVLNVAISQPGRLALPTEYDALQQLNRQYPDRFIPLVFGRGQGHPNPPKPPLEMFGGQWLSDYHEVHLTAGSENRPQPWVVWDDGQGPTLMSEPLVAAFYRQAIFILTYYYNPFTFDAVLDWHHAAGDFVLRQAADHIDVRLITVRRYAPLFQPDPAQVPSLNTVLDALVLFFLRTSLWMRLDRLDGVGELTWASDPHQVLLPLWQGFLQGLERMAGEHGLPEDFQGAVIDYLRAHSEQELHDLCDTIVEKQARHSIEKALLGLHLHEHSTQLAAIIQNMGTTAKPSPVDAPTCRSARKTGLFY